MHDLVLERGKLAGTWEIENMSIHKMQKKAQFCAGLSYEDTKRTKCSSIFFFCLFVCGSWKWHLPKYCFKFFNVHLIFCLSRSSPFSSLFLSPFKRESYTSAYLHYWSQVLLQSFLLSLKKKKLKPFWRRLLVSYSQSKSYEIYARGKSYA